MYAALAPHARDSSDTTPANALLARVAKGPATRARADTSLALEDVAKDVLRRPACVLGRRRCWAERVGPGKSHSLGLEEDGRPFDGLAPATGSHYLGRFG